MVAACVLRGKRFVPARSRLVPGPLRNPPRPLNVRVRNRNHTPAVTERRHDIDALRVIAFALLILYHVGMVYVHDWGFHIKSPHQWEWLQWPMVAANRWRMELIFLLSGIALGLSRSATRPVRMAGRRSRMLLVPLLFGMFAIVPVQAWVEARSAGVFDGGFFPFLVRYWQLRPWPDGNFAGAEFGVTWNHLWYLAYLWTYTVLLALLLPSIRAIASRFPDRPAPRLPAGARPIALLLIPAAWFWAALYWLEPLFGDTKELVGDWAQHAQYLPVFLFGFVTARRQSIWREVVAMRKAALVLAAIGLSGYMFLRILGRVLSPADIDALPDWNWRAISDATHAMYAWNALVAILGHAAVHLNRPFRWLPYANRAVYPWYILHQSLIIPIAFMLVPLGLPGAVEASLVLLATIAGCALIHHFMVLPIPAVRPLFGVTVPPRRAAVPAA